MSTDSGYEELKGSRDSSSSSSSNESIVTSPWNSSDERSSKNSASGDDHTVGNSNHNVVSVALKNRERTSNRETSKSENNVESESDGQLTALTSRKNIVYESMSSSNEQSGNSPSYGHRRRAEKISVRSSKEASITQTRSHSKQETTNRDESRISSLMNKTLSTGSGPPSIISGTLDVKVITPDEKNTDAQKMGLSAAKTLSHKSKFTYSSTNSRWKNNSKPSTAVGSSIGNTASNEKIEAATFTQRDVSRNRDFPGSKSKFLEVATSPIRKPLTRKAKAESQLPFSQIVVRLTDEDESTLGTEGTYLERFPKKKKIAEKLNRQEQSLKATTDTFFTKSGNAIKTKDNIQRSTELRALATQQSTSGTQSTQSIEEPIHDTCQTEDIPTLTHSRASHQVDPPGTSYYLSHNLTQLQNTQHLREPSNFIHPLFRSDENHTSMERSKKEHETHRASSSSADSMESWVLPHLEGRGQLVELDPTRVYVNSFITVKRYLPPELTSTFHSQVGSNVVELKMVAEKPKDHDFVKSHKLEFQTKPKPWINQFHMDQEVTDKPSLKTFMSHSENDEEAKYSESSASTKEHRSDDSNSNTTRSNAAPIPAVCAENLMVEHKSMDPEDAEFEARNQHIVKQRKNEGETSVDESDSSSSASVTQFSSKKEATSSSGLGRKWVLILCCFLFTLISISSATVTFWKLGTMLSNGDDRESKTNAPSSRTGTQGPAPPNATGIVNDNPTVSPMPMKPTGADTEDADERKNHEHLPIFLILSDLISEVYPEGVAAMKNQDTPQWRACKWLESSVTSTNQTLLQRYALATFYYSTNGDAWRNNTGWLSDANECSWMSNADTVCDERGRYIELNLDENNLVGTIPPELLILSDTVLSIQLRKNSLRGEVELEWIPDLSNLRVLDLSENNISGELSLSLFELTSLRRLSLFGNNLTSSIPAEIGQLTDLALLDLGSNKLTSTIPATIGMIKELTGLSLFDNMLSGSVPPEISSLKRLKMLYIDSNKFDQSIPSEICSLHLEEFWGDCEEIRCTCCTACCNDNFGCFPV